MAAEEQRRFWNNVLRATEAEPCAETTIRGASGIQHPAIAVGVDEDRRRLLVISGEHDARTAAMAQVDIQAALANTQVLVARPLALDLSAFAKIIVGLSGRETFSTEDFSQLAESKNIVADAVKTHFENVFKPLDFVSKIPLNSLAQWMHSIQQLARIQFTVSDTGDPNTKRFTVDLGRLAAMDPLELDNQFGVCPVPLFQFNPDEVDLLNGDPNLDDVRDLLTRYQVFQYFFPAPDQLALGLIDRGNISTDTIADQLRMTPAMGHPHGPMELIGAGGNLDSVVDALQDRGLVVEGEVGIELGPAGKSIRTSLRFKPREGLISKVINRFSISIDLKSLIGFK